MGGNTWKWCILVSSLTGIVVTVEVNCPVPINSQPLTCTCTADNDIDWYKNGLLLSTCASSMCIPSSSGDQSFNSITGGYEMVIGTFDKSLCDVYSCKDSVTAESSSFPSCQEPCECKCVFDGGKIAYIIIDCLLDLVFCGAAFFLTCQRFSGGKRPEGAIKNMLIGVFVVVVVILDIGISIYYFAEDCGEDCSDECKSKCCTKGLRIGLIVVAWIPFDIAGYVMIVRYFISGGASVSAWNQTRSNGTAGGGTTARSDTATSPAHARNDAKNGGGKRAQPLPPPGSKPLPSIKGMGNRGLSANFDENSGMTPPEGRGGQVRLQPLKPAGDTIVESDETDTKKKKKKTRVEDPDD